MRQGKHWTKEEIQRLCQMVENRFSVPIIAEKLNRTPGGVYFKIRRLKLKFLWAVDEKNKNFSHFSVGIEPKELMTHEQVLKVLSAALQRLQEGGLNGEDVKRLKTLSILASRYDALLERYERWDEVERRLEHIEAQLEEMATSREKRETQASG